MLLYLLLALNTLSLFPADAKLPSEQSANASQQASLPSARSSLQSASVEKPSASASLKSASASLPASQQSAAALLSSAGGNPQQPQEEPSYNDDATKKLITLLTKRLGENPDAVEKLTAETNLLLDQKADINTIATVKTTTKPLLFLVAAYGCHNQFEALLKSKFAEEGFPGLLMPSNLNYGKIIFDENAETVFGYNAAGYLQYLKEIKFLNGTNAEKKIKLLEERLLYPILIKAPIEKPKSSISANADKS